MLFNIMPFVQLEKSENLLFLSIIFIFIAGVNGSFLTGDLFNLYVFFEVMLISSYVLITLGGTKIQLRESLKYVIVNVVSIFLFPCWYRLFVFHNGYIEFSSSFHSDCRSRTRWIYYNNCVSYF